MLRVRQARRSRIPPFRRRELISIYIAALAFGLVAPLFPAPLVPAPFAVPIPVFAPRAPVAPSPGVQVDLVVPAALPKSKVLNRLVDPRTVALTFDDGPDPLWTPQVLAVLQRHGAVATFCTVGNAVDQHPELVKQLVDAGMRLCNHSRTHDVGLPGRSQERMLDEVVNTKAELTAAGGGAPVAWFRAPGGNWSPEIVGLAARNGMQPLGWNVDPQDWKSPGAPAIVAAVRHQIRQQAPDGAIILLHDGGGRGRQQTVDALDELIPLLAAEGYRFGFPKS